MSQEIAIRDDGFAISERSGNSLIKGLITKFADSIYRANKTETVQQAPEGPAFLVPGIVTAWVHWKSGLPDQHKITRTGQTHPWREDLDDDDKTEWELGIGGLPSDPWRDTRYVYLINLRSGKTYTFVSDTVGGRQAVGELKDAIMTVRQAQPNALPVVQLATGTMKTKYGLRPKPDFKIIDWRNPGSDQAQQQSSPQQLEAEFGKRRTPVKPSITPKPAPVEDVPFDDVPFDELEIVAERKPDNV
jgi:hypothetical protein